MGRILRILHYGTECEQAISFGRTWLNSCGYPGGGTNSIRVIVSAFHVKEQYHQQDIRSYVSLRGLVAGAAIGGRREQYITTISERI